MECDIAITNAITLTYPGLLCPLGDRLHLLVWLERGLAGCNDRHVPGISLCKSPESLKGGAGFRHADGRRWAFFLEVSGLFPKRSHKRWSAF